MSKEIPPHKTLGVNKSATEIVVIEAHERLVAETYKVCADKPDLAKLRISILNLAKLKLLDPSYAGNRKKGQKKNTASETKRELERQKLVNKTLREKGYFGTANREACDEAIKGFPDSTIKPELMANKPHLSRGEIKNNLITQTHRSRILALEKIRADRLKAEKLPSQNHSSTRPSAASSKVKKSGIGKQSKISSEQFSLKKILTPSEISFLDSQHLSEGDLYDGRLEGRQQYSLAAKHLGKTVIIGSKCKLKGHRLRTRSGHCMQCHPSKIAYASRHSESAYLYVAASHKTKILKVGISKNIVRREQSLSNQNYGGLGDWEIICSIKIPNAGAVEGEVHAAVQQYQIVKSYTKDGLEQQAGELVEVSLRVLHKELIACLKEAKIKDPEKRLKWKKSKTALMAFYK